MTNNREPEALSGPQDAPSDAEAPTPHPETANASTGQAAPPEVPRTLDAVCEALRDWEDLDRVARASALAGAVHHLVAMGCDDWATKALVGIADRTGYPDEEDLERWLRIAQMHHRGAVGVQVNAETGTIRTGPLPLGLCGPDLWPGLIAEVDRAMQPSATMDIRQHATARALKARTLEMLRTRAAEAGPVRAVTSTAAIDGALDALLGLYALACQAPARVKPLMDGIVQAQLQVVLGLAGLSRSVPGGEG